MSQKGNDTITLPFNPTDDRLTDAVILVNEVLKQFDLNKVEKVTVLVYCLSE